MSPASISAEPGAPGAHPWRDDGSMWRINMGSAHWSFIDTGPTAAGGVPLVMLPGSVGTCEVFFKQVAALRTEIRIIAATYPALSDPNELADALAAFLTELGIERAHVLGSSFAGYWIQFAALRHSARIETLILCNAFLEPADLLHNALFSPDLILRRSAAELQQAWCEHVRATPDCELRRLQLDMLSGRQDAGMLQSRLAGVVQARPCPIFAFPLERVAIIDCDDDQTVAPSMRGAVRSRYAGARSHALRTGGHYPHIINPSEFNAVLRELVTS